MYAASIQRLCLHTSCHNLRNVVMSHLHSHALSMVTGAYENAGRAHVDRRWEGLLEGTHSGLWEPTNLDWAFQQGALKRQAQKQSIQTEGE